MKGDSGDGNRSKAIEQLQALGLSVYAARTYVALVALGEGTAQDVSDVADVPRTRVYDAAAELCDRGLVDVQGTTPKRFWPVSVETAGRLFRREYENRVTTLTESLEDVEAEPRTEEQRGVWTVTGRDAVTDRVLEFLDGAEEEVVYMTVEELLTDPILDRLDEIAGDGVTIQLGGVSESVGEEIERSVSGVETFETMRGCSDVPAGRVLMVDGGRTLASVLVDGNGDHPPEPRDETAIWGTGETNSLVVVLKAAFTWQLDGGRD
jgi:sugar-specific transcriptional regulator TrmB